MLAHDDTSPIRAGERDKGEPTARVLRRVGLAPRHRGPAGASGARPPGAGDRRSHEAADDGAWFASCLRVTPDGAAVAFLADRGPEADLEPDPQVHTVPVGGGPVRRRTSRPGPIVRFAFDPDGVDRLHREHQRAGAQRRPDAGLAHPQARRARGAVRAGTVDGRGRGGVRARDHRAPQRPRGAGPVHRRRRGRPRGRGSRSRGAGAGSGGRSRGSGDDAGRGRQPRRVRAGPRTPPAAAGQRRLAVAGRYRTPEQTEIDIKGPAGADPVLRRRPPPGARGRGRPFSTSTAGRPGRWGVQSTLEARCSWRRPATAWCGRTSAARSTRRRLDRDRSSGDWGGVDAADCHAVLDHLVRQALADPDRLGCFGNSYGGFMVNWLVGTSHAVRAPASRRTASPTRCPRSPAPTSAPTTTTPRGWAPQSTPRASSSLWRQSPLRQRRRHPHAAADAAGRARPALPAVRQRAAVRRAPLPAARGRSTCSYPESAHEMSWTSRPDRRIDRAERILAWFKRDMAP